MRPTHNERQETRWDAMAPAAIPHEQGIDTLIVNDYFTRSNLTILTTAEHGSHRVASQAQ